MEQNFDETIRAPFLPGHGFLPSKRSPSPVQSCDCNRQRGYSAIFYPVSVRRYHRRRLLESITACQLGFSRVPCRIIRPLHLGQMHKPWAEFNRYKISELFPFTVEGPPPIRSLLNCLPYFTNPQIQQKYATGAATSSESSRSSTPPNPGSQVLESLTSASRLKSDSAKSPTIPAQLTSIA